MINGPFESAQPKHNYSRVIFIVESTFNKRDYKRFGVETLINQGFNVEIWDFTPFINSTYFRSIKVPDPISYQISRIFNNKNEVLNTLLKLDNKKDTVIPIFNPKRNNEFIFDHLANNSINFGFVFLGANPYTSLRFSIVQKIKNNISNPKYFIKNIYQRLLNFSSKKYPANFFIVAGNASKIRACNSKHYCKKSIIISAHAFDYDVYLEEEKKINKSIIQGEYIVMLDEYNLYHPDNLQTGVPVNPKTYYKDLNIFFEYIEDFFKINIVIAAHPRSHSEKMKNSYGGRKKFYGKTIQLIKNAKMVLAHASTSLNFAVLYNKPVIFLNSIDYSNTYKNSINSFSKALSKTPIDVSSAVYNKTNYLEINDESYKLFKELFIKTPNSPETPVWNIFADFIKKNTTIS